MSSWRCPQTAQMLKTENSSTNQPKQTKPFTSSSITSQRPPDGVGMDEALVDILLERRHPDAHHLLDLHRKVLRQQRLSPLNYAPVNELRQFSKSFLN